MKTNGRESLCSYDNSQSNQEFKLTRCSEWVNEQHDIKNDYDEIKDETPKIIENNTIKNDTAKRKRRPSADSRPKKKCTIQEVELTLECEWKKCHFITEDYSKFQLHVKHHMPELALRKNEENKGNYLCFARIYLKFFSNIYLEYVTFIVLARLCFWVFPTLLNILTLKRRAPEMYIFQF